MKAALEKAKLILTKELGREPTEAELVKFMRGIGLMGVNGTLEDPGRPRLLFEEYSKPDNFELD